MPTGCLDNAVSVGVRTARYPRPICRQSKLRHSRYYLISRLLHQKWAIQWTQDLLPELSGETWVASALMEELTWDLPTVGTDIDLVTATCEDQMLQTVRSWVESGNAPPWPACAGLSPELRCWRIQVRNLKIDSVGRLGRCRSPPSGGSQLVVPVRERQELIRQFHDSLFAGHLGITRTIFHLLDRVYWPGLRRDVKTYITSCMICLA